MSEHNFVSEEGNPLKGGDTVGVRAADEFVLAVGEFYELCLAKLANELGAIA